MQSFSFQFLPLYRAYKTISNDPLPAAGVEWRVSRSRCNALRFGGWTRRRRAVFMDVRPASYNTRMNEKLSRTTLAGMFVAVTTCCVVAARWGRYGAGDGNLVLTVIATAFVVALLSPRPWVGGLLAGILAVAVVSYLDEVIVGNRKLTVIRASIARLPTAWAFLVVPIAVAAWAVLNSQMAICGRQT